MIRQLNAGTGRERVVRATQLTALVVGDPRVSDRRFPPLSGAAEEARTTAELLSGQFRFKPVEKA